MYIEFPNDTHMIWDWRVALDQFFGTLGIGLFLMSLWINKFKNTATMAAKLAPIAVIIGLIFLLLEVGRPFNSFYILLGNPSSILFWGFFAQVLFIIISILYALNLNVSGKETLVKKLGIAGGILAILIGLYHGLLLSVVIARPVWNNFLLPIISLASGLIAGSALVMYLATRVKEETEELLAALSSPFKYLLIAYFVMLIVLGLQNISAASSTLSIGNKVLAGSVIFWVGAVIIGVIVPFLLSLTSSAELSKRAIIIVILVWVGALAYRFILLKAGSASVVFNLPLKFF